MPPKRAQLYPQGNKILHRQYPCVRDKFHLCWVLALHTPVGKLATSGIQAGWAHFLSRSPRIGRRYVDLAKPGIVFQTKQSLWDILKKNYPQPSCLNVWWEYKLRKSLGGQTFRIEVHIMPQCDLLDQGMGGPYKANLYTRKVNNAWSQMVFKPLGMGYIQLKSY